nr:sugar phosphate isomerase/epimerase [Clostridia bacterium]
MRLATSTNLFSLRFGEKTYLPFADILRLCHDAGFRVMDANFCAATGGADSGHPLTVENWQAQIEGIRNTAEALGMSF